jgi:predicted metal-dependent hydrolase
MNQQEWAEVSKMDLVDEVYSLRKQLFEAKAKIEELTKERTQLLNSFNELKRHLEHGVDKFSTALFNRAEKAEAELAAAQELPEALRILIQAWADYRQHSSDGDIAQECCTLHYDAMDEAANRANAYLAALKSKEPTP